MSLNLSAKLSPQQRWHQFRDNHVPQLSRRQKWRYAALSIIVLLIFIVMILPFLLPLSGETIDPQELIDANGDFMTLSNTSIYYQHIPTNGETVILVHGQAGSTKTWRSTLPALAEAGYNVYAIDLPGYGLSEKGLAVDFSHEFAAGLILDFMDAHDVEAAHLVAHAFGANIAVYVAQEAPERVLSLALAAPTFFDYPPPQVPESMLNTFFIKRWLQVSIRWILPVAVEEQLRSAVKFDEVVTDDLISDYSRLTQTEDWELTVIGVLRDSHRNQLPLGLEATDQRIMLFWGTEDGWATPDAAEGMLEKFPHAALTSFEGVGHMPMHEVAADFNDALINFLDNSS